MSIQEEIKSIMVVDDDEPLRTALKEAVSRMGYNVITVKNPIEALDRLDRITVSMIITDMKMPKMDGLSFIREARKRVGSLPILVITGFATVENAVGAMKEGVCDYLIKPFSFEDLTKTVKSILSRSNTGSHDVITKDENMKNILQLAGSIAASDVTVLILGESGTGKELLARYIHTTSRRCRKPLIAVNCAAIPDNLLESELFGYEKGAFTGAGERKIGKFELADGGTILLDEIGEMSAILQAKLLRVLQEREVDRVGGRQPVPVDVRVIATTNRDIEREMAEGRFREDLFYRLSVFPIELPPLRERTEDIRLLSEHFARKYSMELKKTFTGFTADAVDFLKTRQWRGNIRELQNSIHRAMLISRGNMIKPEDFIHRQNLSRSQANVGSIRDMEIEMILKTLKDTRGNKTKAAKLLGVSVRTIRNKLNTSGKNVPAL